MKIPLHLKTQAFESKKDDLKRLHLHQEAAAITGGKGFRQVSDKPHRTRKTRLTQLAEGVMD
jgi:hypothetical protein